ncbi:MAG: hypothetical protein H6918_06390 [Sphingomonadaceae bacterium]|nr:hypothetical protein [Sphingomonadaceae bacterium]
MAQTNAYQVGQVWTYDTAAEDSGSLIKIQAIEMVGPEDKQQTIYHISMSDIALKGASQDRINAGHLPVSRETLDMSVTSLTSNPQDFPDLDYRTGMAEWRRANGGWFTISLQDIAGVLRKSFARVPTD